jgi:predicted nucleic acid-binding Zn ribbon protein
MKNNAEVKPVKLGETLTCNDDGNPEPSRRNAEGVETRRRVCIRCSNEIPSHKYKSSKYCSDKCRNAARAYRHAVKTGRIKKPGVGSGGNQEGQNNHQYIDGLSNFRKTAFAHLDKKCNRCGSTRYLCVHHKDHNHNNNRLNNLEIVCKSCHQKHHYYHRNNT